MGYTKDLWTRPDPNDKSRRIHNARWGKGNFRTSVTAPVRRQRRRRLAS
jgi:hypothetical protein